MENLQRMIDYVNEIPDFNMHNGIVLTEVRENYASCRAKLTGDSLNPQGIVHGGLLFAMCDFAGGYSVCSDSRPLVTQTSSFSFLRSCGDGEYLWAEGIPVKVGKRTAVVDSMVYDDKNTLLAKGTFTYFYVD
ncbi:MAG: PaaI family thioesterase [Oscillospiraceae bacterium]